MALDTIMQRTPFQRWVDGEGPRAKPTFCYVASSWRNLLQQGTVGALRAAGIPHYDFRNPQPGNHGFSWRTIHENWKDWTPDQWRSALEHPIAEEGYALDRAAMDQADCGIFVLPAGRSASLEVGYMAGQGKPVFTLCLEPIEPELMIKLLGPPSRICTSMLELLLALGVED